MYSGVKSTFTCMLGVSVFICNVLEQGMNGIDVESFKLYGNFCKQTAELQTSLDLMYEYCICWKLIVNIDKTIKLFSEKVEEFQMILNFYMTVNE